MKTIFAIIIILFGGYIYASPLEIQVTDIDGRAVKGDGIKFEDNNQVTLLLKGATPTSFACNNLVGISFYGNPVIPSIQAGAGFRITLVNQDVLYGMISDTAKNGFTIYNNIIGKIPLNFEQISAIERVGDEEYSLSLMIVDAVKKTEREDTIFLISGDVDSGVVISLSSESVSIRSTLYNQDRVYKISDVRAINLFSFPAKPEKTANDNLEAIVYLTDNSRLNGLISRTSPSGITLVQNKGSYQVPIEGISFIYFKNNHFIYLSDLEPADVKEYVSPDDNVIGFLWHYQKDRELFSQKPISILGRKYFKGLAVHANCELAYKLDGSYQKFFATIGLTDESVKGENNEFSGSVKFIVYADGPTGYPVGGKKVYESEVFKKDSPPKNISLDIKNAKEIRLVVSDAGDGYILDRAVWALARVIR
jgi:hypothetical protein